jgi:hypothetical protein
MRRGLVLIGLGVAGSQAGHLLAYQLRFEAAAQQLQSSGAHAYFPAEVKTALGLGALALLDSLLVIAVARGLAQGPRSRRAAGPSYVNLLAALFTIQLLLFAGQEAVESIVAGLPPDSAATLMLWGTAGQLPAAALLAAALRCLWTRVEEAVGQLRAATATLRLFVPAEPLVWVPVQSDNHARSLAARSPLTRRGPPHSS